MDLHALAREIENAWRRAIQVPVRPRGGSDANTTAALRALGRLLPAVPDADVRGGMRELERWRRTAGMVLGDLERPRRLPVAAGGREIDCPWCRMQTLRMLVNRGIVICVNPVCVTPAGEKATAALDYSTADGIRITWHDGTIASRPAPWTAAS